MAIFGRERKARSYPKKKHDHVYSNAREWWVVEATNAAAARALCLQWPTTATSALAKIIDHRKRPRG